MERSMMVKRSVLSRSALSLSVLSLLLASVAGAASAGPLFAADTQPAGDKVVTPPPSPGNAYDWGQWPAGKNPLEVGKRIVQNFIDKLNQKGKKSIDMKPQGHIGYPEACTAYGSMRFCYSTHDTDALDTLLAKYDPVVGKVGTPGSRMNKPSGVDASVCAAVPLEMFLITGKEKYRDTGLLYAQAQFDRKVAQEEFKLKANDYLASEKNGGTHPPEGLSWQTRYWVDDMFMITGLQIQAYRASGDRVYADRCANEMVSYLDKLQQPNGLFYHSFNAPFYWGRGNGWFAVGMAEVLSSLPEDHPQRARIMEGYKKMMAALQKYQTPGGYWNQLVDDSAENPKAWGESSCTAMFTFALATGVRHGWLDDSYKETARKGWLAVTNFLDDNANMRDVCVGTNKSSSRDFYYNRPRETGNPHGQAAAIWAAWSLLNQQ